MPFGLDDAATVMGILQGGSSIIGGLGGGEHKGSTAVDRRFAREQQYLQNRIPDYALSVIKQYLEGGAKPTYSSQMKGMTGGGADPNAYNALMSRLRGKYSSPQAQPPTASVSNYLNSSQQA